MQICLLAIAGLLISAFLALMVSQYAKIASLIGCVGALLSGILGLSIGVFVLTTQANITYYTSWKVPNGELVLHLDSLAAVFLVILSLICCTIPLYIFQSSTKSNTLVRCTSLWPLLNLLFASLFTLILAANGFLFLFAWEIMALSSYFLVSLDHQNTQVRHAAWQYLVAAHISGLFLLLFFVLAGNLVGSFNFVALTHIESLSPFMLALLVGCLLIGFGTKAGLVPFHAWLPDTYAHSFAFVPAILSGVVSKVSLYGLFRLLALLNMASFGVAIALISLGIISALYGILMALSQNHIKRIIAYSSIENIGLITLAYGLGLLGVYHQNVQLATLGFAGALLHCLNHAAFKSFLFLLSDSLEERAHIETLEDAGGLYKQLPRLGTLFLIASLAITALPPLNGFFSEYLIYLTGYNGALQLKFPFDLPFLLTIPVLALVGGIALTTFSKLFGIVFLGVKRHERLQHNLTDLSVFDMLPFLILATCCLLLGAFSSSVLSLFSQAVSSLSTFDIYLAEQSISHFKTDLQDIAYGCLGFALILTAVVYTRNRLMRNHPINHHSTWGCGYNSVTARMQYTGSSLGYPLLRVFKGLYERERHFVQPKGVFARPSSYVAVFPDFFAHHVYQPLFSYFLYFLRLFRFIQHGHVRLYVLYIVLTLIALLTWKLG